MHEHEEAATVIVVYSEASGRRSIVLTVRQAAALIAELADILTDQRPGRIEVEV